jgi:hypothetical protein
MFKVSHASKDFLPLPPVVGPVVWSLRQTGKNDVEYCITFMLFFESATSE